MKKEEQINFFKKQVKLEHEIVKTAEISVKEVKNIVVRELILGIAQDSHKHASLLNALIALENDVSLPFIQEEVSDQLRENIEKHIKLEQEAIDTYSSLLDQLKDKKTQIVIKAIYQDEVRHHKLLQNLNAIIVAKETVTEEDLWEWLYYGRGIDF